MVLLIFGDHLVRAAWQAAVHCFNFHALRQQPNYDLATVLNTMIDQRIELGLLPAQVR